MRITHLVLLVLLFPGRVPAAVIPATDLYVQKSFSRFEISPDGNYVLRLSSESGDWVVDVFQARASVSYKVLELESGGNVEIKFFDWIDCDSFVVGYGHNVGKVLYFLVDVTEKNGRLVFERQKIRQKGYIVDPLPDTPEEVIFAYCGNKNPCHLHVVKFRCLDSSRCRSADHLNPGMSAGRVFMTDREHRVRIAVVIKKDMVYVYGLDLDSHSWRTLVKFDPADEIFFPQGFVGDHSIAVISNLGRDRRCLQEYDLNKRKVVRDILATDQGEVLSAVVNNNLGQVTSARIFANGRIFTRYLVRGGQDMNAMLGKAFPGKETFVISQSLDQKHLLLLVAAADEPGTVYHYAASTKTARPIMAALPSLKGHRLVRNEHVQVIAEKGYRIDGLLARPPGKERGFPLVVMPHGGPIGIVDMDIFSRETQFLVSRGYGVLRVNFSGSGGYGKKFIDQGRGQWGKRIEDDIKRIVAFVEEKYELDDGNACIIGSSYGGYSALMSVILFPGQYRCAVSSFGVTDIPLLIDSSNFKKSEAIRKAIFRVVGDPQHPDIDHHAVSPFYQADKINVPVLLIAGWKDIIVDPEHSHRLHYLLQQHGKDSQFVLYPQATHGHMLWTGHIHEAVTIDAYLRTHLDVPLPESNDDMQVLTDEWYAASMEFRNASLVWNNPDMAQLLLELAATNGHQKAQFELAKGYMEDGKSKEQAVPSQDGA